MSDNSQKFSPNLSGQTFIDPLALKDLCWPDVYFYDKQREIIYSVVDNVETIVPAGNALGKDFVSAFISLWFFISRPQARVVTTSVKEAQLYDVLWAEIRKFIETSKYKLPIQYNHMQIRKVRNDGSFDPVSSIVGQVVNKGESLLGRHLPRGPGNLPTTLALFDEASGIHDDPYNSSTTWSHRRLIIGNPFHCEHFFKRLTKLGDLENPRVPGTFIRKIIKIRAVDSPNVRLALAEIAAGKQPSGKTLVPGVKDWDLYEMHRLVWDPMMQSVGLDAEFYEGKEVLMFPSDWLAKAQLQAARLAHSKGVLRKGISMGVDPGQGGDDTSWSIGDYDGLIYQKSMKTPDTSEIPGQTIALMNEFGVSPDRVLFDLGGGGKEHVDYLRKKGYKVQGIGFGESATDTRMMRRVKTTVERTESREDRYTYFNRRAELYGTARLALTPRVDPDTGETTIYGIPSEYTELLRQLSLMPIRYDSEGRLKLPPKNRRTPNSDEECLVDIIGNSPDEADSFVLMRYALHKKTSVAKAGVR